ncbi:hypothetical protein A6X21_12040 [Planctopirus hydrillae]|uniref:DUF6881 domain-containing protein n=2 Tax=Planctopirus hydrillae TaxID=1841610 RepID=A0A1C3E625_9PLAN|nr:hypothetical protein A6X21_12040 [Planctopirus hydrillae]
MEYLKVPWKHDHADEPVWLYSEINNERWETRKVEVFRDGSTGYADNIEAKGGSKLSIKPLPTMAEIAKDSQFVPSLIGNDEFERVWSCRVESVRADSAVWSRLKS